MMEAEVDIKDQEGNDSKQGVHIVEEVASALEEEGFLKIEATMAQSPATIAATITSGTVSKPAQIASLSTPTPSSTTAAQLQPSSSISSPPKQRIHPGFLSQSSRQSDKLSQPGSTWQSQAVKKESENQEETSGAGVWGWMSSAVSASLQTTQSIGRNLVEKTKVADV